MFRARDLRFIVPILGFSAFLLTLARHGSGRGRGGRASGGTGRSAGSGCPEDPELEVSRVP